MHASSPWFCAAETPHARREQVWAEQRRMGMEPRNDSRLTALYADGGADVEFPTARAVAHELCLTDLIHRRTLYGDIIEAAMRRVAYALKEDYPGLPWKDVWDVVRFYAPTMLKLHCLRSTGHRLDVDVRALAADAWTRPSSTMGSAWAAAV